MPENKIGGRVLWKGNCSYVDYYEYLLVGAGKQARGNWPEERVDCDGNDLKCDHLLPLLLCNGQLFYGCLRAQGK